MGTLINSDYLRTVTAVVRIIAKRTLREFWETHPDAKDALEAWHSAVRRADWDSPEKVIQQYSRASIIGSDRVVFRLKGGRYRLIVSVNYVRANSIHKDLSARIQSMSG